MVGIQTRIATIKKKKLDSRVNCVKSASGRNDHSVYLLVMTALEQNSSLRLAAGLLIVMSRSGPYLMSSSLFLRRTKAGTLGSRFALMPASTPARILTRTGSTGVSSSRMSSMGSIAPCRHDATASESNKTGQKRGRDTCAL